MPLAELPSHEFSRALPLLAGFPQRVLPFAICEGFNPGQVWVDHAEIPHLAMIWSPVGYYFLAGELPEEGLLTEVRRILCEGFIPASQAGGETGFLLITGSQDWKDHLADLLPGREVIEIYRRRFDLPPDYPERLVSRRGQVPLDFQLVPLDEKLAVQAGVLASWASVDDFLHNGFGFALLHGSDIASQCWSIYTSHDRVEIDVHTHDNYRRRGFAVLTASALIEACLRLGKQPNWECFWDNQPSIALAEKIGFMPGPDYPVYYWEE